MGVFKAEPFTRPRPCLQYSQYDMNEMAFKNLNDKEVKVRPAGELSYRQHGKQR